MYNIKKTKSRQSYVSQVKPIKSQAKSQIIPTFVGGYIVKLFSLNLYIHKNIKSSFILFIHVEMCLTHWPALGETCSDPVAV